MRWCVVVLLTVPFLAGCNADANDKLKSCCAKLTKDDPECVKRFCDFDAIAQTNVSLPSFWGR